VYEYKELRCTLGEVGAHIKGPNCTDAYLGSHRLAGERLYRYG
jgi:hypothetical protein